MECQPHLPRPLLVCVEQVEGREGGGREGKGERGRGEDDEGGKEEGKGRGVQCSGGRGQWQLGDKRTGVHGKRGM